MQLRSILSRKGTHVWTCSPHESLAQAVSQLVAHGVGSLVVVQRGKMIGILTERDILRACEHDCQSLQQRTVGEQMTADPVVATADADLQEVMGIMTKHRIRHLPVMDGDVLVGLVSIGDVVKFEYDELSRENHYLKTYLSGAC